MVGLRHLHILEVLSVLLFSLLANYVIELKIDFKANFDFVIIIKVLLLTITSFNFYLTTIKLKEFSVQAKREYESEKDVTKIASNSLEQRYFIFYSEQKLYISMRFLLSVILGILFFIIEPIIDVL